MDIFDFGWLGKSKRTADYFMGESTEYGRIARKELRNKGIDRSEVYALAFSKTSWTVSANSVEKNCKFLLIWDKGTELEIWLLNHGFWDYIRKNINIADRGYYSVTVKNVEDYAKKIWHKTIQQKEFREALNEAVEHLKKETAAGGNS